MQQTRFHHTVGGTTVTSVDESKPTYYYYDDCPLPMFDPYLVAMEFYLKEHGIGDSNHINPKPDFDPFAQEWDDGYTVSKPKGEMK
jgi:hypothetical protein